jgi:DNA-cytosine methyltransferase
MRAKGVKQLGQKNPELPGAEEKVQGRSDRQKRAWHARPEKNNIMKFSLAEFFCGCGGFSRGFAKSGRFDVVLGNDIKKEALHTFRFNHRTDERPPATILRDIRTIPLSEITATLNEKGVGREGLDCLIGGPPCQGFSQLRRTEEREHGRIVKFRGYSKLAHDPRNDLVLRFLEVAEHLKPKVLLIENVPQMLSHGYKGRLGKLAETVVDMLQSDMRYSVQVGVLNAADYGVPQLRERAFILATSIGTASFPTPIRVDPSRKDLARTGLLPWTTVADALKDLPDPSRDQEELGGLSVGLYRKPQTDYARRLASRRAFPFNHIARSYSESVLRIIREMRPGMTWDSESARMREKYEAMIARAAAGGITRAAARKRLTQDGKLNPVFYKRYYWSAYTRLAWNAPALTITANANFLGSGRFTHPEQLRGITMREAARLQSFDDDFRFITSESDELDTVRIGIGLDMIGEAVPPLLATAFAEQIAGIFDASARRSDDSKRMATAA